MNKESNQFIFPKIKNPANSNFNSGGICNSGRSDDIINGSKKKTNMFFPYLEDLRKLIKEPKNNAKILKPKSMHSERLKNDSEIQTQEENQKNENFIRNHNASKSVHFQKAFVHEKSKISSKIALKKTLCKQEFIEKKNNIDKEIKFPRINFLIDNIMSKIDKNPEEKDLCETSNKISTEKYENNFYNEKFLIARYKFFGYKQKNQIIKEQTQKKKPINTNPQFHQNDQQIKTCSSPKNDEIKLTNIEIYREKFYSPLENHQSEVQLIKNGANLSSNFFSFKEKYSFYSDYVHSKSIISFQEKRKPSFESLMVKQIFLFF